MAPRKDDSNEKPTPKKKEFGTGLRAQLERRREEPDGPKPAEAQPNVELRFELRTSPADQDGAVDAGGPSEQLRQELAAALAREQELKATLEQQQSVVVPVASADEQSVSRRAAALDDREAKLSAFEDDLEMRVGESRSEALKKMATRVDAPELSAFVRAIIQADQLGISLGRILRVQATDTRLRRQAAAEEKAMKAPIKMLFPTVLFIFPAMFLVILGPAFLNLSKLF